MAGDLLLDREVSVHYGQMYAESAGHEFQGGMAASFQGQVNGLCGAAVPGFLFLLTGTHTGRVGLAVELHRREPVLDDRWEDVVEVSFGLDGDGLTLTEWGGGGSYPLAVPGGAYRVRYCARGMTAGRRGGVPEKGHPPWDHYLLQLWPAPPAPDRVVRESTAAAAYWHRWARSLPPPPTPEQIAERERREAEARRRREADLRAAADRRRWGDRVPNDRLRRVGGNVRGMERVDMDLVFALAEADERTLRAVAHWAAESAYAAAGLTDRPWVAPALAALRDGRPLPPPFDDPLTVWRHLDGAALTTVRAYDGTHPRVSQQHAALPALFGAVEPDPLQAALDALFAAVVTHGEGFPGLLAGVRRAFPQLTAGGG